MWHNCYVPNSFELNDLLDFVEQLPPQPPDNGEFFWVLKNREYVRCLRYKIDDYCIIKQGDPDTMLNIPIIVDDTVMESCIYNFTEKVHKEYHEYLCRIFNELLDDFKEQDGRNIYYFANNQAEKPTGEATFHKLYPHIIG